jgi:membrane protease YdiL (CAAX protease family)
VSALEFPERPAGLPERPAPDERPWSPLWALPIFLGGVILGTIAYVATGEIRQALTDPPVHADGVFGVALQGTPPVVLFVSTLVQQIGWIVASILVVAWALKGRVAGAALGLRPARLASSAGYVVLAYVTFILLAAVWTLVMDVQDRENVAVDLGTGDSAFAFVAGAILTTVMAPLAEELFFRGFLYGGLRRYGVPIAAIVSGLLFGAVHIGGSPIGFLVPLAALGIILALLYERTGSLYPPIALHALNNSIAFGVSDGRAWMIPVCLAASALAVYGLSRALVRTS